MLRGLEYFMFENIIPNLHANVKNQSFEKVSFSFDVGRTGRRADSRRVTGRLIPELQMRLQVYLNIPISHFIFFMGLTLTELSIYSLYVETQLCPLPRSYYCDKHRELLDRPPESIFSWNMFSHIKTSSELLLIISSVSAMLIASLSRTSTEPW